MVKNILKDSDGHKDRNKLNVFGSNFLKLEDFNKLYAVLNKEFLSCIILDLCKFAKFI